MRSIHLRRKLNILNKLVYVHSSQPAVSYMTINTCDNIIVSIIRA